MNYAVIKKFDIANGPGVRASLFVSGCRHRCKNCFNSEAWNFNYGKPFDDKAVLELMQALSQEYIEGFSLLGGEPFEPENRVELVKLLRKIRSELPQKTVWCYTGFLFEDLLSKSEQFPEIVQMLECMDVLVDGRFVEELKNPELIFRGSENQRILDVKASLLSGKACLFDGVWQRKMGSGNIYD